MIILKALAAVLGFLLELLGYLDEWIENKTPGF